MEALLLQFKKEFEARVLRLLWRQWTTIGVAGSVATMERIIIDPEALMLLTCTAARSDPRMFDAMLHWLEVNGRYVNISRLHRMIRGHGFEGEAVLAAVGARMRTIEPSAKWSRISARKHNPEPPEPLFYLANAEPIPMVGKPDPVFLTHGFMREVYVDRGISQPFNPSRTANLLLRLRAFLGVNARCEILGYLLTRRNGSPRAIARSCSYYPATVSKALAEMGDSGLIVSRVEGRRRFYKPASHELRDLFIGSGLPVWLTWAPLLRALEMSWLFLRSTKRTKENALAQASGLRRLLKASMVQLIAESGIDSGLAGYELESGEVLIPFFIERMNQVLDDVDRLDAGTTEE